MKFKKQSPETVSEENENVIVPEEETGAEQAPVSKGRKILNTVVNVVLIAAIVIAACCTYVAFVSASGNGVPSIFGVHIP